MGKEKYETMRPLHNSGFLQSRRGSSGRNGTRGPGLVDGPGAVEERFSGAEVCADVDFQGRWFMQLFA